MSKAVRYTVSNMPLALLKPLLSLGCERLQRRFLNYQQKLDLIDLNNLPMLPPNSNVNTEQLAQVTPENEIPIDYGNNLIERKKLESVMQGMLTECVTVPIVIKGEEFECETEFSQVLPYRFDTTLAKFSYADKDMISEAICATVLAQEQWNRTPINYRIKIWEDAANLMATKYRLELVAATVLGQGKTITEAELDVCALIDFMRFNVNYLRGFTNFELLNVKPTIHKNFMRLRGIFGFVAAISPFNSTSIAGNLAYAPALMGNAVLWKPSDYAILSNWYVFSAMREAGVPDGVVNFVPSPAPLFAKVVTGSHWLGGVNFTGSSGVFKELFRQVAQNLNLYESFPRLVGECGGKNFHFVHASADVDVVVASTIRAAFEYGGQKCSSCSMLYVPSSLWSEQIKPALLKATRKIFVHDASLWGSYFSAVINERAYNRIHSCLEYARVNKYCKIIAGGQCSKVRGYFVEPTVIEVTNLDDRLCIDEILGPVLCVYVYSEKDMEELVCRLAFANNLLSGSVFATDDSFIKYAIEVFSTSLGNLNINDKSTCAIVGQQPMSGGRLLGTNDKPGSPHYLLRWTSPLTIKETYVRKAEIGMET